MCIKGIRDRRARGESIAAIESRGKKRSRLMSSSKSDAAAGYDNGQGYGDEDGVDESPALRIDSSVLVEGTPPAARGGHTSFL